MPLVDCFNTKSMYILPPKKYQKFEKKFSEGLKKDSEQLFQYIKNDVKWIKIKFGQLLIFNQSLPHGNRVNIEKETRWSMNCRFKSVFTPFGDKKIGEFFEPITLRKISEIGMRYKLPKINETIKIENFYFKILERQRTRLTKINIKPFDIEA